MLKTPAWPGVIAADVGAGRLRRDLDRRFVSCVLFVVSVFVVAVVWSWLLAAAVRLADVRSAWNRAGGSRLSSGWSASKRQRTLRGHACSRRSRHPLAGSRPAASTGRPYGRPWLGYKATDRVTVWGVAAGYGAGGLLLTPDGGPALESGLSMAMAAAGTRGDLIAGASGFELAFKTDALWVGTSVDGVDGAAGRLAVTEAAVTRFRTGLEGSRDYTLAGRLSLRPSVEVGLRHDGGDAETGAGMDIGGGLVVADAGSGLAVDVQVRMLVVHQAEGFRERGMAVSLSYNPTPSTPTDFTVKVAPSWGGRGEERRRGAVGPGDDGGDGARTALRTAIAWMRRAASRCSTGGQSQLRAGTPTRSAVRDRDAGRDGQTGSAAGPRWAGRGGSEANAASRPTTRSGNLILVIKLGLYWTSSHAQAKGTVRGLVGGTSQENQRPDRSFACARVQ